MTLVLPGVSARKMKYAYDIARELEDIISKHTE